MGSLVLGPDERIPPGRALQLFLGNADDPARPRSVAPGQPSDLCVLTIPPPDVLAELASDMVVITIIAGQVVYPHP
jgi:hypothetical protein